jgi:major membrane immunogen (membrane-anchored lipoprotein)
LNIKKNIFYRAILVPIVILSSILIPGCSSKTLNEDKFVKIYAEIIIAQDTAKFVPNNFKPVEDKIFKRYGITGGEYSATVDSYNKDPEKWEKFFNKAISYVESLKKQKQPGQPVRPM